MCTVHVVVVVVTGLFGLCKWICAYLIDGIGNGAPVWSCDVKIECTVRSML